MTSKTTYGLYGVAGLAVIAVLVLMSSVQVVNPGQTKTVTYFGELQNDTLDEGMHFINPLKGTRTYDVRTQTYTMSAGEGDRTIEALTSEGLNLETMDISVRYHLNEGSAVDVHRNLGDESTILRKLIRPSVRSAVRQCTAEYTSSEIYSVGREELPNCIRSATTDEFESGDRDYTKDFDIEKVQVRNIQLPQQVRDKIQEKKRTEQELEIQEKRVEIAQKKKRQNEILTESLTKPVLTEKFINALDDSDTVYIPTGSSGTPQFVENLPGTGLGTPANATQ
jgi:regulator of protease activity HflC (stomatin/prohibitin superfamily)